MSLPLAHALVGGSLAVVAWPVKTPAGRRRSLVVGSVLGICPDLDYALNWLHVLGRGWHHGFTHSVSFALVVGVGASWAFGVRGWRGALVCAGAVLFHPLLDYWSTESGGVALGWPVMDQRFKLGIPAWSYYQITTASQGWLAFVKLLGAELVIFGPVLAIALWWSRRRYRAADPSDHELAARNAESA